MTENKEVYKCEICGNIVEVLNAGGGTLTCCGEVMKHRKENGDDKASKEKHVPIIKGNVVAVGSIAHPMEEKHYIEWIEATSEEGEVAKIFPISGANMTIIIRHGKYLSVYSNIVNVKVKMGDKVDTKQEIGDVYSDPNDGNNCILKFMIFEKEYLNPELWIAKN